MNRSTGVTVVAVLVIIGSAIALLGGAFAVLGAFLLPVTTAQPPFPRQFIVLGIIFISGTAGWGIATAIGLFRLRRWARISILVFSGFLVASSALPLLVTLVLHLPRPEGSSPADIAGVLAFMSVFYLSLIAVGIWWLIYFTRKGVEAQFQGQSQVLETSLKPLSITVIAWFLLVGGILTPFCALTRIPAMVLGTVLTGSYASVVYLLYGVIELLIGIGLLKMKPLSHTVATCFYLYALLNGTFIFLPGRAARMAAAFDFLSAEMQSPGAETQQVWFGAMFGLVFSVVPLYFLLTRRKAFLAACQPPSGQRPGLA